MNNLITKETTKKEWLNQYRNYPSTLEGGLQEKPWYESRILPIFYEIPMNTRVLDIGCNDGTFMAMLRDKRKCSITGIDVSEGMVQLCRGKGLDVVLGDAERLPFEDGSFDVVCLMEVLAHVITPEAVLKEAKRVLRKGGFLLGSSPHKNLERHLWDDKRLHRRYQDESELRGELDEFFPATHIKVLTGGQFAASMAGTFMGDQPAEILFKCGGLGTFGWASYLKDRSILRAWFGPTTNPATAYYRMTGFCDQMQKMDAETFYEPYEPTDVEAFHRWQLGVGPGAERGRPLKPHVVDDLDRILDAADMSVFQITPQKGCLAFLMAAKAKYKTKPMLVELDDWIFDLPSYNHAAQAYEPHSDAEKTALAQIKLSDGVICSTQYIKSMLGTLFPGKPAWVVRNGLDFDLWDTIEPLRTNILDKGPKAIRIAYTGCDNHTGDLDIVKKPIMALLAEFPDLQMVFPTPKLAWEHNHPQIFVSDRWMSIDRYPAMIKGWNMDIGIAPLRDNHANRAKSNLRWLEYSALRVPTVASNIGPFKETIFNNEDGVLVANNPNQWYEALRALIVDQRKRTSIGHAAYARVKKEFSMANVAKEYLETLKAIKRESLAIAGGGGAAPR